MRKGRIWRDSTSWIFGEYLPHLDGKLLWHFDDGDHWMEADTFDLLLMGLREYGWWN